MVNISLWEGLVVLKGPGFFCCCCCLHCIAKSFHCSFAALIKEWSWAFHLGIYSRKASTSGPDPVWSIPDNLSSWFSCHFMLEILVKMSIASCLLDAMLCWLVKFWQMADFLQLWFFSTDFFLVQSIAIAIGQKKPVSGGRGVEMTNL